MRKPKPSSPVEARAFRPCHLDSGAWLWTLLPLLGLLACSPPPDDEDPFQTYTSHPAVTPTATAWPAGVSPSPPPDSGSGHYPLGRADAFFTGASASDQAGYSAIIAGDLNGDGYADLVISSPGSDLRQPDAGAVTLLFGGLKGIESQSLSQARAWLEGEGRGDRAGQGLAALGDINGDGLDDLAIGAPFHDGGGTDAGKIYLIFGRSSGWYPGMRLSDASAGFVGGQGEALGGGDSIAGQGDFNGDGYTDLLVGSPFDAEGGPEAGRVTVITGRPGGWQADAAFSGAGLSWIGEAAGSWLGASMSFVRDLNGDGQDEVLVGAPRSSSTGVSAGKAWLLLGEASITRESRPISTATLQLTGETAGEEAGGCVVSGTDLSGDGLDELIIGASGNSTAGTAGKLYVVEASADLLASVEPVPLRRANLTILGTRPSEFLGKPALGVGDVDGSGFGELLLGVWNVDAQYSVPSTDAGLLFTYPEGGSTRTVADQEATWIFDHEQLPDAAGFSLGGGGDVNGDGFPDFLIGAPLLDYAPDRNTPSEPDVGRVYLYYGGSPFEPQTW